MSTVEVVNSIVVTSPVIDTISTSSATDSIVSKEVHTIAVGGSDQSTIVVESENPTVIAAGQPGPAGINEEDMTYSKRTDFVSESVFYKGEAPVGSAESAAVWRIRKVSIGAEGDVTEIWADGSDKFTKVWADRLSLSYS